jgi:hypothetical protein
MDVTLAEFLDSLTGLDRAAILAIAGEVDEHTSSAAGELEWWTATMEIERQLRMRHAARLAGAAALRASQVVIRAAIAAGMSPADRAVTTTARAAAAVARGLVIDAAATEGLIRNCGHLVAA